MIHINLDLSEIEDLLDLDEVAEKEMKAAARRMAAMTHAHAKELANQRLHSRRGMFLKGLSYFPAGPDTWVINLDAKVRWIDDGLPAHSMIDDLLNSKKTNDQGKPVVKVDKDGNKYMSVPFQHNKERQNMTDAQQTLMDTIRKELPKGVTLGGIETNAQGQPKMGLVRSLDIMTKPVRQTAGRGQGRGPIGHVMQGFSESGDEGIPLLQGVRIYQKMVKDDDGHEKVGRFVMTFRTVSSKHRAQGRWEHPGTEAVNIFEDTAKWAVETWENEIAPQLINKIKMRLG